MTRATYYGMISLAIIFAQELCNRMLNTCRVCIMCHDNIALKPLDRTWIFFESSGLRLVYIFFSSTAAKLIAYLRIAKTCIDSYQFARRFFKNSLQIELSKVGGNFAGTYVLAKSGSNRCL
jgi:hypothetical protein